MSNYILQKFIPGCPFQRDQESFCANMHHTQKWKFVWHSKSCLVDLEDPSLCPPPPYFCQVIPSPFFCLPTCTEKSQNILCNEILSGLAILGQTQHSVKQGLNCPSSINIRKLFYIWYKSGSTYFEWFVNHDWWHFVSDIVICATKFNRR